MRAVRVLAVLLLALALGGCGCATYSNRLGIGPEPNVTMPLDGNHLRPEKNEELPRYAQLLGFFTTPFKRMGVMGWRDMKTDVVATGVVEQSAWSTDYFLTVDMALSEIVADGQPVDLKAQKRYLRAEICERRLGLPASQWPCPGDTVRITGRLLWDADGFLEVHPQTAAGVEILEKASCYTPCPMSRTATTTTRTTSTTTLAPCR